MSYWVGKIVLKVALSASSAARSTGTLRSQPSATMRVLSPHLLLFADLFRKLDFAAFTATRLIGRRYDRWPRSPHTGRAVIYERLWQVHPQANCRASSWPFLALPAADDGP